MRLLPIKKISTKQSEMDSLEREETLKAKEGLEVVLKQKEKAKKEIDFLMTKLEQLEESSKKAEINFSLLQKQQFKLGEVREETEKRIKEFAEISQKQRDIIEVGKKEIISIRDFFKNVEADVKEKKKGVEESLRIAEGMRQLVKKEFEELFNSFEKKRLELAQKREEIEKLWGLIEKNKEIFGDYKKIEENTRETLEKLILKIKNEKQDLEKTEEEIEKISKNTKETFKVIEEKNKEINQKVELNNLKITSLQKLAELTEERFKNWEQKIKNREEVLLSAFKEARQKGIL